jgi:predicted nucleic acid-binding protein
VTLVLDASAVAAGLLPDEAGAGLDDLAARDPDLCVPPLLPIEVWNLLLMAERRQRITQDQCNRLLTGFEAMQLRIGGPEDALAVLALARRHRLTVYDALYLDLALCEGAALATRDRRLAEAAVAEGIALA